MGFMKLARRVAAGEISAATAAQVLGLDPAAFAAEVETLIAGGKIAVRGGRAARAPETQAPEVTVADARPVARGGSVARRAPAPGTVGWEARRAFWSGVSAGRALAEEARAYGEAMGLAVPDPEAELAAWRRFGARVASEARAAARRAVAPDLSRAEARARRQAEAEAEARAKALAEAVAAAKAAAEAEAAMEAAQAKAKAAQAKAALAARALAERDNAFQRGLALGAAGEAPVRRGRVVR